MGQLEITVVEGRNLKQKDKLSEDDAFLEIYLDDKKSKQKTKTKLNSNNPQWNESFVFNHLKGQDTLHIDVYDKDSLTHEKIGSIQIDLNELYEKGHIDDWFNIPDELGLSSHGEIHLILHYEQLNI